MLMKGGMDWNPHGDVLNICSCKAVVMTSMPINSCSPFDRLEIPSSPHEGMRHSGKSMLPDWIVSFEKSQDKGTCSMKIMHWEGIFEIGLNTYVRPWNCKFSMFDTACELVTCYSLTSVRQLLCQSYKHALCYCLKPYLGCARSQRRARRLLTGGATTRWRVALLRFETEQHERDSWRGRSRMVIKPAGARGLSASAAQNSNKALND